MPAHNIIKQKNKQSYLLKCCFRNMSEIEIKDGKVIYPNKENDETSIPKLTHVEKLIEMEATFGSIDVREKVKVLEQAKTKSLGDFIITSKPKQSELKKKKKEAKAKAKSNE